MPVEHDSAEERMAEHSTSNARTGQHSWEGERIAGERHFFTFTIQEN